MNARKSHKNHASEPEATLWGALRKGEMDALGKLYDLYVDELFEYGNKISTNRALVMDSIHDLFLSLYKYHSKLAAVENIRAYLFLSLKRTIHKKGGPRIVFTDESKALSRESEETQSSQSYEEELIAYEHSTAIKSKLSGALDTLTQKQQHVLQMRYEQDVSYEEIAQTMGVSLPSARTFIYRALKVLRKGLLVFLFILH